VTWQNVLVDIHPTSLYRADHDMALIGTVMQLQAPSGDGDLFVLPADDSPVDAPIMRVIDEEEVGDRVAFEQTSVGTVEGELAEALEAAEEADRRSSISSRNRRQVDSS
jgi:hypothetical protein